MKLFKKAKKGFTLVELVVVIAVIAILAAVSVGAYFGVTESAKTSQCTQEAKAIHTAMVLIANDPAVEGVDIDENGLDLEDTIKFNNVETTLVDLLEDQTGITYAEVNQDFETGTDAATIYFVNGPTGKYSVAGKIATITWATGDVTVA